MKRRQDCVVMAFEMIFKITYFYAGYWFSVKFCEVIISITYLDTIVIDYKILIILGLTLLAIAFGYHSYKLYELITKLTGNYWIKRLYPEIIKLNNFVSGAKNIHLKSLQNKYLNSGGQENIEWINLNNVLDELFDEFHSLIGDINPDNINFEVFHELSFIIYHDFLHWNQIFLKKPIFELSLDEILDNTKESDYCIFGVIKKMQKMIIELQVIENV